MKTILLAILRVYQVAISPMIGPSCRFHPTCSEYAVTAISRYGVGAGVWLAGKRLLRCHPWHAGGHDPVPGVSDH